MITVEIKTNLTPLARLTITKLVGSESDEVADYMVKLVVDRGDDIVGVHRRVLESWPRNALNSMAMLKAALNLFDGKDLGLEDDYGNSNTGSSDMEREERRALPALPPEEESELRNY